MGGSQSSTSASEEEGLFVNENMRSIQDGLSWQPKKEMPATRADMSTRERERHQEYQRKRWNRSARINNISQQWAASHMANSSVERQGSVRMRGGQVIDDAEYQKRWTCCGLFP